MSAVAWQLSSEGEHKVVISKPDLVFEFTLSCTDDGKTTEEHAINFEEPSEWFMVDHHSQEETTCTLICDNESTQGHM